MYAFCYGTLKSGYGNNRLLEGRSTFVTNGTLPDYRLYYSWGDSGFPVATHSQGDSVCGEVFLIDEDKVQSVLRSLDGLEGYIEESPEISMYIRETVVVVGDDGQEYECQTYRGNSRYWDNFTGMTPAPHEVQGGKTIYTWSR